MPLFHSTSLLLCSSYTQPPCVSSHRVIGYKGLCHLCQSSILCLSSTYPLYPLVIQPLRTQPVYLSTTQSLNLPTSDPRTLPATLLVIYTTSLPLGSCLIVIGPQVVLANDSDSKPGSVVFQVPLGIETMVGNAVDIRLDDVDAGVQHQLLCWVELGYGRCYMSKAIHLVPKVNSAPSHCVLSH